LLRWLSSEIIPEAQAGPVCRASAAAILLIAARQTSVVPAQPGVARSSCGREHLRDLGERRPAAAHADIGGNAVGVNKVSVIWSCALFAGSRGSSGPPSTITSFIANPDDGPAQTPAAADESFSARSTQTAPMISDG
jgi:hypothetical protein